MTQINSQGQITWRSGIFEFVPDSETVGKLTQELRGDDDEYLTWSHTQRLDRIRDIQAILEEDQQTTNQQATLWFVKGNILVADRNYEEAIASYDHTLEIKPDDQEAWYNRGVALSDLGRDEEAVTSYDHALEIKPDCQEAWNNRGTALSALGRYEQALMSFEQALQVQPNFTSAYYNKACYYGLRSQIDLAIDTLQHAIALNPKYRDMAKTDSDFDRIRDDERFQAVVGE